MAAFVWLRIPIFWGFLADGQNLEEEIGQSSNHWNNAQALLVLSAGLTNGSIAFSGLRVSEPPSLWPH